MKTSPSLSPEQTPASTHGRRVFISIFLTGLLALSSAVASSDEGIRDWKLSNLLGEAISGARYIGGDEGWKNRASAENSDSEVQTGTAYTLFRSEEDLTVGMLKTAAKEVGKALKQQLHSKGISSENGAVAGSAESPATSETRFSASFQGTREDGTFVWISFYIVPTGGRDFAVITSLTTVGKK